MSDENFQFYSNIEIGNYFIKFKNVKNGDTCEILIDFRNKGDEK